MSDHWVYIWPAYAASAIALIGLAAAVYFRGRKRLRRKLDEAEPAARDDK